MTMVDHPYRLEWMEDPWDDVTEAGEWLLALEREIAPDVVHLNGYCHAALPWRAPVVVTGHSCVLSWWQAVHGTDAPASWGRYAAEVGKGVRAASLVTAPSDAMLRALERYYGPLPRRRVIGNGRALPRRDVPKEPFVFSAGRLWDEAKNVEAVCAVAPQLSWPVRVAGDTAGPDGDWIRCDHVEYLGRLSADEVASWMARASIYALPARYEPFGLSVLEAALSGCALVLGDIPSLREIWGDTALYAAPGNRRMLTAALTSLVDDDGRRQAMASAAQARAAALTPARMAAAYLGAYQELVGEVRPLLSLSAV
jgi:glycosyltransferase involved in cell wall biosynthesis